MSRSSKAAKVAAHIAELAPQPIEPSEPTGKQTAPEAHDADAKPAPEMDALQPDEVLQQIFDKLPAGIDFRRKAGVKEDEKVSQKSNVVIVIAEVLTVAREINCGLCKNGDFIYSYNGAYWRMLDRESLTSFLGDCALKLGVDQMTSRFHLFRDSLLKQSLTVAHLPTPTPPENTVLINLQNCTLEITDGKPKQRGFQRDDFLTYQLPFVYDPKAQGPKWQAFLDEVLSDEARQKVLPGFF